MTDCVALGSPVTHQLFMDDLKVHACSKWGLSTTVNVLERVFKAIGMELGLRKCAVAHMVAHDNQVEDHTLEEEWVIGSLTQGDVYCYLGIEQMFKPSPKTTADKIFPTARRKDVCTWRKFSRYLWRDQL